MIPGRIRSNINVFAKAQLGLRAGDLVSVQVIKRLIGNKWAIGIKGQVFPATSDIELAPGQRIRTLVRQTGQTLNLQIKTIFEEGEEAAARSRWIPDTLLQRLDLEKNASESQLLGRIVKLFNRLTANRKRREARIARSIAFLFDKGLDPSVRGLEDLIKGISFIDDSSGGRHKREGHKDRYGERDEELMERLQARASEREESEEGFHPLHIVNHTRGKQDCWFIIPFSFFGRYQGIMKVLVHEDQRCLKRLILDIPLDDEVLSFILTPQEERTRLSFCCEEESTKKAWRKKIREITPKLQNHGVDYDDSIYDGGDFDGFYLHWEGPTRRSLDILI